MRRTTAVLQHGTFFFSFAVVVQFFVVLFAWVLFVCFKSDF